MTFHCGAPYVTMKSASEFLWFHLSSIVLCWTVAHGYPVFWKEREAFLLREKNMFLGSNLILSDKERKVNDILMKQKELEFREGLLHPGSFPPARHFFLAREDIEKSQVFRIIKRAPKGAALHVHIQAVVSTDFLLSNLTYMSNLYTCYDADGVRLFRFFERPDERCDWQLVSEMRQNCSNVTQLDEEFRKHLTLATSHPRDAYSDTNAVWRAFRNTFKTVNGLVLYRPAFELYYTQLLTEFHEDEVMYLELRSQMFGLYDLNGKMFSREEVVAIYNNLTRQFMIQNSDFLGVKIIYAAKRREQKNTMKEQIQIANELYSAFPELIVGFDLVGQEDLGHSLEEFAEELQGVNKNLKFFYHAGETDWKGLTDMNLVDAILLNATRIGHGYAITKHPLVLEIVKQREIAIEVNPISNQVLMLVEDLRNHPAAVLLAENYPVVISSDDPSFWGAKGLSYDMYEVFMGIAGLDADLRVLKQLALNSLRYSALDETKKKYAIAAWEVKWNSFIDEIINTLH